jgi:hypothetical protein
MSIEKVETIQTGIDSLHERRLPEGVPDANAMNPNSKERSKKGEELLNLVGLV